MQGRTDGGADRIAVRAGIMRSPTPPKRTPNRHFDAVALHNYALRIMRKREQNIQCQTAQRGGRIETVGSPKKAERWSKRSITLAKSRRDRPIQVAAAGGFAGVDGAPNRFDAIHSSILRAERIMHSAAPRARRRAGHSSVCRSSSAPDRFPVAEQSSQPAGVRRWEPRKAESRPEVQVVESGEGGIGQRVRWLAGILVSQPSVNASVGATFLLSWQK
jgi:hypothetical protein